MVRLSLHPSLFNVFFEMDDGGYLLFNTLHETTAVVDEDLMQALKSSELFEIPGEMLSSLSEQKVVVDYDELSEISYRYNSMRFSDCLNTWMAGNRLNRTIYITPIINSRCNLACDYCTQPTYGDLDPSSIPRLVSFMKYLMKKHKPDTLLLCIYGGEPLLSPQILRELASHLAPLSSHVKFFTKLFTNGTLLDQKLLGILDRLHLIEVHITLDGNRTAHDKIRKTSEGGTFDTVLQNAKRFAQRNKSLVLRINIDDLPLSDLPPLLQDLSPLKNSSTIYFTRRAPMHICRHLSAWEVPDSKLNGYINMAEKWGFRTAKLFPGLSKFFCGYLTEFAYVLTPPLDVFSCMEEASDPTLKVGHIDEKGEFVVTPHYYDVRMRDPLTIPECRQCIALPFCQGGCLHLASDLSAPGCVPFDRSERLARYIKHHYPELGKTIKPYKP